MLPDIHLVDSELLLQILGDSVLVDHDVHGFAGDEILGHIPNALILAALAPRVLDHVVESTVLILGHTVDLHSVVVSSGLVVKLLLTGLLSGDNLLGNLHGSLLGLSGISTDPTGLIASGGSGSFTVSQSAFTSLRVNDDPGDEQADGNVRDQSAKSSNDGDNAVNRSGQRQSAGSSSISSDVYHVDPTRYYISGISPQTTVAAFKKNMSYDGYTLTIYRGNTVKKSGNIGTAMTAVFESDEFIYTYELAITGDITGEGSCNSRDLNTLMDYLIGASDFNGVYMLAADVTNDNKVDVCDAAKLKSII